MIPALTEALATSADAYAATIRVAMMVSAVLIAISAVDDLFIDAWFWVRTAYRKIFVLPNHKPLAADALYEREQQPIAIMAPAWREDDVIAPMLSNMVAALDYDNYVIFAGTYPNDPDTIREVERVRRRHRQIVRVEVPHGGPTCKADCLNAIVEAARRHEEANGFEFAGFILHDCEDVVHPMELRFFNYLLPRKDLIQLPVVSLERGLHELVAGTYMDEFAEWHAKDLVVRESFADSVPSAGVGTCFSRRAIEVLCEDGGQAFNTDTLTEDYDIGTRLAERNMPTIVAHFPVEYRVKKRNLFGAEKVTTIQMSLCVREYFPNTFRTSYRQKARWVLGIALQGWQQLGWSKSIKGNYFMLRDRKSLIMPILSIVAYVLLLNFAIAWTWHFATGRPMPDMTPEGSLFVALLTLNGVAAILRILQRMHFTNRLYGWRHAVMSIPRTVVGTFVNCAATVRALRLFFMSQITGKRIAWDKTMHHFPSTGVFDGERRALGEILAEWEAVKPDVVQSALDEQQQSGRPLGKILMSQGWLDEETLAEAIATQADLARAHPTADMLKAARGLIPEGLSIRTRSVPIGRDASGAVVLAVSRPLSDLELAELAAEAGRAPIQKIVRESEIAEALRLLRGGGKAPTGVPAPPLLGDILIDRGHVRREAFEEAMKTYQPERHGRIGERLLKLGVITDEALMDAVAVQNAALAPAGH